MREGLAASSFVRQVSAGTPEPVIARVRIGERGVDVLDQGEDRVIHPLPPGPDSAPELLRVLEVLTRAQALREFESGDGADWLEASLDIEWGRVLAGRAVRLPTAGACLHSGERIYIRLHNRGRSRLYVSVFDIGVGGCITLLSTSQPSGLMIGPARVESLGTGPDGRLVGLELEWPRAVPPDGERPESLVVIAAEAPMDLRLIETSGQRWARAVASPLEGLLRGSVVAGSRAVSLPGGGANPVRYAVKHIRFWLDPRPAR
jgi:hypothetical protein